MGSNGSKIPYWILPHKGRSRSCRRQVQNRQQSPRSSTEPAPSRVGSNVKCIPLQPAAYPPPTTTTPCKRKRGVRTEFAPQEKQSTTGQLFRRLGIEVPPSPICSTIGQVGIAQYVNNNGCLSLNVVLVNNSHPFSSVVTLLPVQPTRTETHHRSPPTRFF